MTRVLIAAASAVVRAGLEAILRGHPDLEVIGTATGVASIASRLEQVETDVVLLELERRESSLVSAPALAGAPPTVILTDGVEGDGLENALRLGARAVLPRDADGEEIAAAVKAVAAGLMVLHPSSAPSLLPFVSSPHGALEAPAENLTPREVEVLSLLAEGAGNKLIARRLGISEHTVKFHVGSILAKLNASSRTEAVTVGVRHGLIML